MVDPRYALTSQLWLQNYVLKKILGRTLDYIQYVHKCRASSLKVWRSREYLHHLEKSLPWPVHTWLCNLASHRLARIVNSQHTCAARVTVVGLPVYPFVNISHLDCLFVLKTLLHTDLWGFLWNCFVTEIQHFPHCTASLHLPYFAMRKNAHTLILCTLLWTI